MAEFIELILIVAVLAIVFGARRSGALGAAIGRALLRRRGAPSNTSGEQPPRASPAAPDVRP